MQLDLSKSTFSLNTLKTFSSQFKEIYKTLHSKDHSNGTTWVDWPLNYDKEEFEKILSLSKKIKKISATLLVVGIGGSYLGAKSGIEMLKNKKGCEVVFVGTNLDGSDLNEKLQQLKDKEVYVNVISKSGTTLEILSTYHVVEKFIKNKYKDNFAEHLIFTTDKEKGYLRKLANDLKIETLSVPDGMGGRYSVLSAVGLLPFACAGLDIKKIMQGALQAYQDFLKPTNSNLVNQYAAYRYLINTKLNKKIELFASFSSKMAYFGQWLTQLFNESEGKDKKGMFVTSLNFSTDLHSVGQFIQEGSPIHAETFIDIENSPVKVKLEKITDSSPIKFLEGKTFDDLNRAAFNGTVKAHQDANVPIAILSIEKLDEFNYGYLVYFFEKACAVSAYLLGVNPFNQPGVEQYKQYMKTYLNKK